ncbi:hypothetical protein BN2475_1450002 [Paraburkholderia ribeironis]|uniref:Uncharacterized protein n=1 Tax=Paraburkholderia ribeironis TaxID=1247936 RepID=A0A1N7SQ87_9BURK|nr:hypothetical protein BN2475_1450002 [Paraburkholderia ribeironis]
MRDLVEIMAEPFVGGFVLKIFKRKLAHMDSGAAPGTDPRVTDALGTSWRKAAGVEPT